MVIGEMKADMHDNASGEEASCNMAESKCPSTSSRGCCGSVVQGQLTAGHLHGSTLLAAVFLTHTLAHVATCRERYPILNMLTPQITSDTTDRQTDTLYSSLGDGRGYTQLVALSGGSSSSESHNNTIADISAATDIRYSHSDILTYIHSDICQIIN